MTEQQKNENHILTSLAVRIAAHEPCIVGWLRDSAQFAELSSYLQRAINNEQPVRGVVLAMINKYGLPSVNVDTNACDRYVGAIYTYLHAIRYALRYPAIDVNDNKNCQKLKELSEALELEKLSVDKRKLAGVFAGDTAAAMSIISEYQANYNAAYAGLSCATVLLKTQKQETLTDLQIVTNDSNKATTGSNANNVVTIVAVLLVVVIIIKIFKG